MNFFTAAERLFWLFAIGFGLMVRPFVIADFFRWLIDLFRKDK